MATHGTGKLIKLSDAGETVAVGDEDLRGRSVRDKDGNDLGKVDDLLLDARENKVRFLEVASGGFLGLGKTKSFIPIDAITDITERDVNINQTREHVARAPAYDPDLVDDVDDMSYYENLYFHYGYMPYWGAGYTQPRFPHYRRD
ncbi:PRC-barrel domain-containing protein [Arthrobacter livingstonensis]|uniref:PRC-barrel domain-containing protein n=1 Tax=Arthrobacter livingstonensis TaxID=670078 RepID=A0A2V5L0F7_9MICC|nr:PRC-barrel domain-containing protein [Arthrobacter livingstonensis]PYI64545.1 PRC-barrel domain-containing protein [Arthrobacter livingstonensis]